MQHHALLRDIMRLTSCEHRTLLCDIMRHNAPYPREHRHARNTILNLLYVYYKHQTTNRANTPKHYHRILNTPTTKSRHILERI